MIYTKLRRTWTRNDINYIPEFIDKFPELKHLSSEELCGRFSELGVNFYEVKKSSVKWYVRLTLPFALILMLGMLVTMPIKFIVTGHWKYSFGKNNYAYDLFKSLKIQ